MADAAEGGELLTAAQAYEAAYRFVVQYHERDQIEPFFNMLCSMGFWTTDDETILKTADPATWPDWQECVRQTLAGETVPSHGGPPIVGAPMRHRC